jgi:hypothetical protein
MSSHTPARIPLACGVLYGKPSYLSHLLLDYVLDWAKIVGTDRDISLCHRLMPLGAMVHTASWPAGIFLIVLYQNLFKLLSFNLQEPVFYLWITWPTK